MLRSLRVLPEQRAGKYSELGEWIVNGARSAAGVEVTPSGALASTTVLACVNLIARSLASVPLVLYRRTAEGQAPADAHPLTPILSMMANPLQTAMEVRETIFANVLLHGNAYCEIEWGVDGYPVALWPLAADRSSVPLAG
jgi:HK97 family phage portal protein